MKSQVLARVSQTFEELRFQMIPGPSTSPAVVALSLSRLSPLLHPLFRSCGASCQRITAAAPATKVASSRRQNSFLSYRKQENLNFNSGELLGADLRPFVTRGRLVLGSSYSFLRSIVPASYFFILFEPLLSPCFLCLSPSRIYCISQRSGGYFYTLLNKIYL